jgi:putative ABC transport system ATP-binding protein
MNNPLIEAEDLSVRKNGNPILTAIDLRIGEGEKVLVRGESGCGKSTLLRSLMFFERFRGRVAFRGTPVGIENITEYRNGIGYLGQTIPLFQAPVDRVLNIPYGYRANRRIPRHEDRKAKLLAALNFQPDVLDREFSDLSGGEKQRILILQILMMDKAVLFFDEVTAALDQKNIDSAVREITSDSVTTVISISHNREWEGRCTRTIEMDRGRIVSDTGGGHGSR